MKNGNLMALLMILCLTLMVGCNNEGGEQVGEISEENMGENTYIPLTRENLANDFGITDEDLQGIEFETIVELEHLGSTSFKSADNKDLVVFLLKDSQEKLEADRLKIKNDKTYLFNAPEYEGEIPDLKDLKYLSIEHDAFGDDADKVARFIDFDKKIFYVDTAQSLVADVMIAYVQSELEDQVLEDLIVEMEALGIRNWDQNYDLEGRDKYMVWDMGLEFQRGEIISYHGTLNEDGGYPESFRDLLDILQAME